MGATFIIELPAQQNLIAIPVQSLYNNEKVFLVRDSRLVGVPVNRVGELDTDESGYQLLVQSEALIAGAPIVTTQFVLYNLSTC